MRFSTTMIFNFHDSNPSGAPAQAKVLLNSVSISPRYSITKLENFDSTVCMTPRSQDFRLSKTLFLN